MKRINLLFLIFFQLLFLLLKYFLINHFGQKLIKSIEIFKLPILYMKLKGCNINKII